MVQPYLVRWDHQAGALHVGMAYPENYDVMYTVDAGQGVLIDVNYAAEPLGLEVDLRPVWAALAGRLWQQAKALRDGYPGNGYGIGYINGFEDAATRVELLAEGQVPS